MSEFKIASRYATALFSKAMDDKAIEAVMADILVVQQACKESDDLIVFLNSPMLKKSVKQSGLAKIFTSCSDLTKQLLHLMAEKNREAFIPAMTESFIGLYNDHMGITTAVVTSAVQLSDVALESVKKYVAQTSGANSVLLTQSIDPTVIGGLNILFDGKIYDATLSNQILKLKKDLQIA
jgi:F-type H+-transporting ATPase subunit delta